MSCPGQTRSPALTNGWTLLAMALAKKKLLIAVTAVVVAAAAATGVYLARKSFSDTVNALNLDLSRPDALIHSRRLADLPRDLLRVPVLKATLTEEFVDYYESHPDRLAVSGALRRMAYEHTLTLPDRVLESVFEEPAEVAFWQATDGSLKYFALAMTRNSVAKLLQLAVPFVPGDPQLSRAGSLKGLDADLFILEYGYQRRLLLAVRGNRVVVLSHPGMLLGTPPATEAAPANSPGAGTDSAGSPAGPPAENGVKAKPVIQELPPQDARAAKVVAALLQPEAEQDSPFARHFHLDSAWSGAVHGVAVGAKFLSLGYDVFNPGLEGLAFSFDGKGNWHTAALVNGPAVAGGSLDGSAAWQVAPHGASLCTLAPVDWGRLAPLAKGLGKGEGGADLAQWFNGPATVCWYGDSRLYTPLFVANLKAPADAQVLARLGEVFAGGIGRGPLDKREPVAVRKAGDGVWWVERGVETPFGPRGEDGRRRLVAAMAVRDRAVVFSPDQKLVGRALDVVAKRYPAILDSLPRAGDTLAVLTPASLAALVQKETFASLPKGEEGVLRQAAEANLIPRLDSLGRLPPFRLVRQGPLPDKGAAWQEVNWQEIPGPSSVKPGALSAAPSGAAE